MRTSISKPTPFIYLAFVKTDPFIYLIIQNDDLFTYCPLMFCTYLFLADIAVNSLNTKETSSLEKSLSKKICAYTRMSEKWGLSYRNPKKSGHSYTFLFEKKGANHIPGSAGYRPPPPTPLLHAHTPHPRGQSVLRSEHIVCFRHRQLY